MVPYHMFLPPNMVIPASLGIDLDSGNCRVGTRFVCNVPHYPGVPDGCRVEGVVRDVVVAVGGGPGAIDFAFDTLITPNGRRVHIDGHPVEINGPGMHRDPHGRWIADQPAQGHFVVVNDGGRPRYLNLHAPAPLHTQQAWHEVSHAIRRGQGDVHMASGMNVGVRLNIGVQL